MHKGTFWQSDLSQQCYSGYHLALVVALAVPFLVFFAIGYPVFNFVM